MKRICIKHLMLAVTLSGCLLLGGCKSNSTATESPSLSSESSSQAVSVSETATTESPETEAVSEETETASTETTETDTKSLTLNIVNMSGVDIGMFSVIDPVTGEQANLSSLANEESISIEANWPTSVNEFQWALYNMDGGLCIEGKTNISTAETSATLVLTGDGNVEDVEEIFQ